MKKLLSLLAIAMIIAPASCTKPENEPLPDPVIKAEQNYRTDCSAAEHSIAVTVENPLKDCKLTAATNCEWITDLSAGNESVTFSVTANETFEEREGTIVLSYEKAEDVTITVAQSGNTAYPAITVEKDYAADYPAGTHKIAYSIENPIDGAELTAATETAWIENLSVGEEEITFDVTLNDSGAERAGTIVLSYPETDDITITVTQGFLVVEDLSAAGTANCYIVSKAGTFSFKAVKGNSTESAGEIASAEVLWETFGTDTAPNVGDLISSVSLKDEEIIFSTASTFAEGNAVIAAKDSNGKILWSWHIWMTDMPEDQEYSNNAGTMMDRNLGATSTAKGDVASMGLMYQWGRKDPFLGSSSISARNVAQSTAEWPEAVPSDPENGNIEFAIANPTTFVMRNLNNNDWCYSDDYQIDATRWASAKTIYDPCPAGYRIPDGGDNGVWPKSFNTSYEVYGQFDADNKGCDFGSGSDNQHITSSSTCWYPAAGYVTSDSGSLSMVGYSGNYWSCTIFGSDSYSFFFNATGYILPLDYASLAYGQSVRCVKEN